MTGAERLREFIDLFGLAPDHPWRTLIREEAAELDEALAGDDLEAIAEELADVRVTVEGAAVALGIDLDVALAAVHEANMAKLPECHECLGDGYDDRTAPTYGGRGTCSACGGSGYGEPRRRESDGKVLKPSGWQPPDMSAAVADVGHGRRADNPPATKGGPAVRPWEEHIGHRCSVTSDRMRCDDCGVEIPGVAYDV